MIEIFTLENTASLSAIISSIILIIFSFPKKYTITYDGYSVKKWFNIVSIIAFVFAMLALVLNMIIFSSFKTENNIKIKDSYYSQEIRDLPPVHTDEEIFGTEHISSDYFREQIEEYGDLARRFIYPDLNMIVFARDIDVDGGGDIEQVVGLCSLYGNGCPHSTIIIKGDKIIFETSGSDIKNIGSFNKGFILEWEKEYKDPDGYMLTRFKWDGDKFVPTKEYEVLY